MPANCLAPIIKCAYKKAQQQIKEEAFQDGDFLQKVHQYLSSPDVLENITIDLGPKGNVMCDIRTYNTLLFSRLAPWDLGIW